MTRITWDSVSSKISIGVDQVVVYPSNGTPVGWSGIRSVSEEPNGVETTVYYYDGEAYTKQKTAEEYAATIQAVTYPDVLDEDGTFGMVYRVQAGDGYEIHLVYNAYLTPSQVDRSSLSDSAEVTDFQWRMTALPEHVDHARGAAHLIIDTKETVPATLAEILSLLYGTDTTEPRFPLLSEILDLYEANAIFKVVDHGDGTWTATGPDDWFVFPDGTSFEITTPSAVWLDTETYRLRSW